MLLIPYLGFRRTRITLSPLMNSLGMKRSLLTGVEPFLPLPVLGICRRSNQGKNQPLQHSCRMFPDLH